MPRVSGSVVEVVLYRILVHAKVLLDWGRLRNMIRNSTPPKKTRCTRDLCVLRLILKLSFHSAAGERFDENWIVLALWVPIVPSKKGDQCQGLRLLSISHFSLHHPQGVLQGLSACRFKDARPKELQDSCEHNVIPYQADACLDPRLCYYRSVIKRNRGNRFPGSTIV
jgi:hypothetical protein